MGIRVQSPIYEDPVEGVIIEGFKEGQKISEELEKYGTLDTEEQIDKILNQVEYED